MDKISVMFPPENIFGVFIFTNKYIVIMINYVNISQ